MYPAPLSHGSVPTPIPGGTAAYPTPIPPGITPPSTVINPSVPTVTPYEPVKEPKKLPEGKDRPKEVETPTKPKEIDAPKTPDKPKPMDKAKEDGAAKKIEETKNPFELDRRYVQRVGHAADYSTLTGQLYFVHADGGLWVLRYAPLGEEEQNGGSVVLARDRQMDDYREGDLVSVNGEIINPKASAKLSGPLFRVQSIRLVDRPQR